MFKPEPWREFVPWCGSSNQPTFIEGPIRERFVILMANILADLRMEHMIRHGRLFVRGDQSFDGQLRWTIEEIELNFQWKVVDDIAHGVTIDDVYFPPPPALVRVVRESERHYGPFPRRSPAGERIYGPDRRFKNCTLMRAAILKNP